MSAPQSKGLLSDEMIAMAKAEFTVTDTTPAQYAQLRYPKLIPIMRFTVRQMKLAGFGTLMTMDTNAMGGMMRLSTIVFTPGEGKAVPFLLIDTMQMKKKNLAYIEFYDCTTAKDAQPLLEPLPQKYADIPDYAEKPAWYVERRTPYSLIKGGEGVSAQLLNDMTKDAAAAYLKAAATAEASPENLVGLRAFCDEMCTLGNPASATLSKLFGTQGAEQFYRTVIMPVPEKQD